MNGQLHLWVENVSRDARNQKKKALRSLRGESVRSIRFNEINFNNALEFSSQWQKYSPIFTWIVPLLMNEVGFVPLFAALLTVDAFRRCIALCTRIYDIAVFAAAARANRPDRQRDSVRRCRGDVGGLARESENWRLLPGSPFAENHSQPAAEKCHCAPSIDLVLHILCNIFPFNCAERDFLIRGNRIPAHIGIRCRKSHRIAIHGNRMRFSRFSPRRFSPDVRFGGGKCLPFFGFANIVQFNVLECCVCGHFAATYFPG